jgi:hypothetical protein
MNKNSLFAYLASFTFIVSFGLIALLGYWEFWPDNILTVQNAQELSVDKTIYSPGDRITYTLNYCKTRNMPGILLRALVDGFRMTYEPKGGNLPVGCHTINVNDLEIPSFIPSGIYHLDMSAEYKINPLKSFIVNYRTVDFLIK